MPHTGSLTIIPPAQMIIVARAARRARFRPDVPHRMMKLIKIALLLVSILLLAIGGEGIYHAARSRQQLALTCEQFTGPPPRTLVAAGQRVRHRLSGRRLPRIQGADQRAVLPDSSAGPGADDAGGARGGDERLRRPRARAEHDRRRPAARPGSVSGDDAAHRHDAEGVAGSRRLRAQRRDGAAAHAPRALRAQRAAGAGGPRARSARASDFCVPGIEAGAGLSCWGSR